ncbi:catalase [[Mycoplasma] testudinis]|uniref:catalase n=1 Tax=[Mycoplasma] testudinis TaxID=33924 RepID=UPI00069771B1|nr:catalase [[Mycoplasma] testudinis]
MAAKKVTTTKPGKKKSKRVLSTYDGAPIANDLVSKRAGKNGPTLLEDSHLIEKLAAFDRERIPERVVHAKGGGAYGVFTLDPEFDVKKYTRAAFLNGPKGKKTDLFIRFSSVGGEKGSADTERDPRGFSIKFYTEEGNYDLVGNNTPIFFIRDALKFPDFIHTQKRNPQTNLKDPTMFWDFLSLTPESYHQVLILFSDRGTPESWRHMHGYGSHTFMWYTDEKHYYWVKYHIRSRLGSKGLSQEQADELKKINPDFHTEDLFKAIENKKYPVWDVYVQIMTPEQGKKYKYNIFDVTKVVSQKDYPLKKLGTITLNRNPQNYFAEVEQASFLPSNFVPGIAASPDPMLQGRLFSYADTARHRLGANSHLIPVNMPKNAKVTYTTQRDGYMRVDDNGGAGANYYPNSTDDFDVMPEVKVPSFSLGEVSADHYPVEIEPIDFEQPRVLFEKVMDKTAQEHTINNLAGHIKGAIVRVQKRAVALWNKVSPKLAKPLAQKLGLDYTEIDKLSKLSQKELVAATKK